MYQLRIEIRIAFCPVEEVSIIIEWVDKLQAGTLYSLIICQLQRPEIFECPADSQIGKKIFISFAAEVQLFRLCESTGNLGFSYLRPVIREYFLLSENSWKHKRNTHPDRI